MNDADHPEPNPPFAPAASNASTPKLDDPASDLWQVDAMASMVCEVAAPALEPPPSTAASPKSEVVDERPPPLPRILEAMLFAAKEPLEKSKLTGLFRGLSSQELTEVIDQLNRDYKQSGRPYFVELAEAGYQMRLRPAFRFMLERLYGSVKEARLSAALVETLAVVAYRQPVTKAVIDSLRGQDSSHHLRQLLKRGLIRSNTTSRTQDQAVYLTTQRFLEHFKLRSLEELPRSDDLQKL